MKSKRQRMADAAARLDALICPVCGRKLEPAEGGFRCGAGHTVNANRKGYLYMLKRPFDTSAYGAALFDARRRVFAAGAYADVLAAVEGMLPSGALKLLDAGCGEGYYLSGLLEGCEERTGAGIDISRDAIERATEQPCEALWIVGDVHAMPFRRAAFDVLLDVLTPANYAEFARVLHPDGLLVKVWPGQEYLRELRAARGMALYADDEVGPYLREHCEVMREERVHTAFPLTPELWRDFVYMTPLNQDLTETDKEALAAKPQERMTIDLHAVCCRFR